jgi:hypothetical protein
MGIGPVSDSAGSTTAAGAAGSATALATELATIAGLPKDERFALVMPSPIPALVTASLMRAGLDDDSRLKLQYSDQTADWARPGPPQAILAT